MKGRNSLRINQDESGRGSILGVPFQIIGSNTLKNRHKAFELTPELYKALTSTGCTGNQMEKDSDILTFNKVLSNVGHIGDGDRKSAPRKII